MDKIARTLIVALVVASPLRASEADTEGRQGFDPSQFGFGASLSLTLDTGSHDRIDEAEVVNGIVRVSKESNTRARIMLETHYLFRNRKSSDRRAMNPQNYAWGPFVAIQPGSDELLDAMGAGLLLSFKKCASPQASTRLLSATKGDGTTGEQGKEPPNESQLADSVCDGQSSRQRGAFNVGVGLVVDPNTRILGDGLEPNRPLPEGETAIRFKETDQWGVLVLVSFSI